jgi:hypothetical protein
MQKELHKTAADMFPLNSYQLSRPEKTLQVLDISPVFSCHF